MLKIALECLIACKNSLIPHVGWLYYRLVIFRPGDQTWFWIMVNSG